MASMPAASAANDIQVIDLDNYISSGGASTVADGQNFTLTFAGQTTSTITYSSNATTMAANIQTALQAVSNIGAGNVPLPPPSPSITTRLPGPSLPTTASP